MNERDKILIISTYLLEKLRETLASYEHSYRCSIEASEKNYGNITEIDIPRLKNLLKDQVNLLSETQFKLIDIEDLLYKLAKEESE